MNIEMTTPDADPYAHTQPPIAYERMGFGWGAVLAGLAIAIALNIFFAEIGLWMNLGIVDLESSGGTVLVVNAIAWVLTGLVALFVGSWIAGRMANARTVTEGGLHGVAVWAAGAVVMLMFAFSAAGVIGGGMVTLVGKGLEGAGQVAQVAAPSWDTIRGELEGALVAGDSGTGAIVAGGQEPRSGDETAIRDRSRLFELAGRHFGLESGSTTDAEREELVELFAARSGLSKQAAEQTVAQWEQVWSGTVQRYETAKAEALEVAEAARETAMAAAAWAAIGMLLSLVAAFAGGALGARYRLELVMKQMVARSADPGSPPLSFPTRVESGRAQSIN